jgi:hypothetical protein
VFWHLNSEKGIRTGEDPEIDQVFNEEEQSHQHKDPFEEVYDL